MTMKVELRSDSVHISGYVNAVDRFSKPIRDERGEYFLEKIMPGAFRRALEDGSDVELKHNHQRTLDKLSNGSFSLFEDNIGLFFDGNVKDREIIERASRHELVGWSFGFIPRAPLDTESRRSGIAYERAVDNLDLTEVSIIDSGMTPCYPGTSIDARAQENGLCLRAENSECCYSVQSDTQGSNKSSFTLEIAKKKLYLLKFI